MFIKPAQAYGRSPENQLRLTVRVLLGTGFAVCMYIYCTYMMVAGVQGAGAGTAIYDCSWCAGGRNCYCCIVYTYYIRYCTLLKAVISSKFSLRS